MCNGSFGLGDAAVACRQLGFSDVGAKYDTVGGGSGAILADGFKCSGTELTLQECPQSTPENCDHRDDIGVRCKALTSEMMDGDHLYGSAEGPQLDVGTTTFKVELIFTGLDYLTTNVTILETILVAVLARDYDATALGAWL